uniref:Uncharacterized protein n=1 Tax=Solanum tuberosum TaxID=4113 RepID=M1BF56_SOLTU
MLQTEETCVLHRQSYRCCSQSTMIPVCTAKVSKTKRVKPLIISNRDIDATYYFYKDRRKQAKQQTVR